MSDSNVQFAYIGVDFADGVARWSYFVVNEDKTFFGRSDQMEVKHPKYAYLTAFYHLLLETSGDLDVHAKTRIFFLAFRVPSRENMFRRPYTASSETERKLTNLCKRLMIEGKRRIKFKGFRPNNPYCQLVESEARAYSYDGINEFKKKQLSPELMQQLILYEEEKQLIKEMIKQKLSLALLELREDLRVREICD